MEILLARHGNTFGPNDSVVWAGSSNDIPLVEKGVAQAEKLADILKEQKLSLAAVFCGPLQRTFRYASIIVEKLSLPYQPISDSRLNEIDYGQWTGLTNEQVIAKFGMEALTGWDERSQWPKDGNWGGSEKSVFEEVHSFLSELSHRFDADSRILVVTSNGRLRYFLKLVENEFEKRLKDQSIKVKTGHICKLVLGSTLSADLTVSYWNREPRVEVKL